MTPQHIYKLGNKFLNLKKKKKTTCQAIYELKFVEEGDGGGRDIVVV